MTKPLAPLLAFLNSLSANNNKPWFEEHRADYEAARGALENFVDGLIDELRVADKLDDLSAKSCIGRINRDVRFSRDKSPYKTSLGAAIAPGGRKSVRLGYHLYLAPQGGSLLGGGLYMPEPAQLQRFRQAVAEDAAPFRKLIKAKALVEQFGGVSGERLKTAPQGFTRDHPAIDLLQLKQVIVVRHFADAEVLAPDFAETVLAGCRAMKPFLAYLDRVLVARAEG